MSANRSLIADVVRYIPTKKKLAKYGMWNTLFLVFIALIVALNIIQLSINAIWAILLFIIVAMKRFKYYYFHIIFGVIISFVLSGLFLYQIINEGLNESHLYFFYLLPIPIVFIVAGSVLPQKITPNFREKKKKYIDKHNRERIHIVHLFDD